MTSIEKIEMTKAVSCLLTRATEISRQIARVLIIMLGEAGTPPKRRRVQ